MKPIVSMKFLGDEETVRKAIESVAAQGKAKKEPAKETPLLASMVAHMVTGAQAGSEKSSAKKIGINGF